MSRRLTTDHGRKFSAYAGSSATPRVEATKGAIDTLVQHLALALARRGIRVNAVAPGVVETEMSSFTKTDGGR